MKEVVGKILLDDITLVSTADDEVIDSVGGVNLQDMPKDGATTDLDHRLGLQPGFF